MLLFNLFQKRSAANKLVFTLLLGTASSIKAKAILGGRERKRCYCHPKKEKKRGKSTVITWHEHLRFWRLHQKKSPSSGTVSAILRPWRGRINWRHLPRTLLLMHRNDTVVKHQKTNDEAPSLEVFHFRFVFLVRSLETAGGPGAKCPKRFWFLRSPLGSVPNLPSLRAQR